MFSFEKLLPEFSSGSPEVFMASSVLLLLGIGSFKGNGYLRSLTHLALAVLIMTSLMVWSSGMDPDLFFHGTYVRNSFTTFCKIAILWTMGAILFMGIRPVEQEHLLHFEYPILILLATLGMMMMVSANDLIGMYLAVELYSLSLYILVSLKRDCPKAAEAGLKYFILGACASALILYGSSFLYGVTGTTQFQGLFVVMNSTQGLSQGMPEMFLLGSVFLLSGIAFKLALVPFHPWSPDVYEGSSTPLTPFIATAPKIAVFAFLARFLSYLPASTLLLWDSVLSFLAFLSILVGSLTALFQTNIKRILSYSAIAHMGYATFGLLGKTPEGIENLFVYLVLYSVMTIGCFACLLVLKQHTPSVETLSDLAGLSKRQPLIALIFTVFLFSLAGIPPLAGFFAKLGIFTVIIKSGYVHLAFFGLLMSVVSAAYYLKIIKIMYFDPPVSSEEKYPKLTQGFLVMPESYVILSLTGGVTLFYVLFPSLLLTTSRTAILALFESRIP